MDEFTNEEKKRIDLLYGSDFKDITPEDMPLIQRWEQYKAILQARRDAEIAAMKAECEERKAKIREEHEYAAQTLKMLRDKAIARYENRGSDGKEE